MIIHVFRLNEYDWDIYAYYGVDSAYLDIIINQLKDMGCTEDQIEKSIKIIGSFSENTGFTYSNYSRKESVVVVSKCESSEDFMNTLVHEARHLQQHILEVYDIPDTSERVYHLMGKLVQLMYNKSKPIIKSLE